MEIVRSLTKYLPQKVRRKIRKGIARLGVAREMAEHYEGQVVQAFREGEAAKNKVNELEGVVNEKILEIKECRGTIAELNDERAQWHSEFQSAMNDLERFKEARDEYVMEILLGSKSQVKPSDRRPSWANNALVRIVHNERSEKRELAEANKKLRVDHLKYTVDMICGYEKIGKVPVAVYHNGEAIYETDAFEKYVGSYNNIESELRRSTDFSIAMDKKRNYVLKQEKGSVIFTPERMKNNSLVAIAYFVPTDTKGRKTWLRRKEGHATQVFKKYGEKAVGAIYKTLKELDKKGMEFGNGKA